MWYLKFFSILAVYINEKNKALAFLVRETWKFQDERECAMLTLRRGLVYLFIRLPRPL